MDFSILAIVFYVLLVDSLGANIAAWAHAEKWWNKHFPCVAKYFPLTKGWAGYYLILVLFIGYLVFYR